jgi:hypothetical protein
MDHPKWRRDRKSGGGYRRNRWSLPVSTRRRSCRRGTGRGTPEARPSCRPLRRSPRGWCPRTAWSRGRTRRHTPRRHRRSRKSSGRPMSHRFRTPEAGSGSRTSWCRGRIRRHTRCRCRRGRTSMRVPTSRCSGRFGRGRRPLGTGWSPARSRRTGRPDRRRRGSPRRRNLPLAGFDHAAPAPRGAGLAVHTGVAQAVRAGGHLPGTVRGALLERMVTVAHRLAGNAIDAAVSRALPLARGGGFPRTVGPAASDIDIIDAHLGSRRTLRALTGLATVRALGDASPEAVRSAHLFGPVAVALRAAGDAIRAEVGGALEAARPQVPFVPQVWT